MIIPANASNANPKKPTNKMAFPYRDIGKNPIDTMVSLMNDLISSAARKSQVITIIAKKWLYFQSLVNFVGSFFSEAGFFYIKPLKLRYLGVFNKVVKSAKIK